MFVFLSFILGYIFVATFYCENPKNACLLDYGYPSCGWTWDFHPFHLSFIDFIFYSYVHWAHKNLPINLERRDEVQPHPLEMYFMMDGLLLIHPYLEDAYFMMDSLSMFWPSLEDDILPFNLHNLVIL